MFAEDGFTTLAELWTEFVQTLGEPLAQAARKRYVPVRQETDDPNNQHGKSNRNYFDEFGSPADFVEQVFIESFDTFKLTLSSAVEDPSHVLAKDPNRGFRLLERETTFGSTCLITSEEEIERARPWLQRMGSPRFEPWPVKLGDYVPWADRYAAGDLARTPVSELPYHTLPHTYERHRFIIPRPLPPWTEDALDEVYVTWLSGLGSERSICLDDVQAKRWRSLVFRPRWVKKIPGVEVEASRSGRPRKLETALAGYRRLYPTGHNCSLKEVCRAIEEETGMTVSAKTVSRAVGPKSGTGQKRKD